MLDALKRASARIFLPQKKDTEDLLLSLASELRESNPVVESEYTRNWKQQRYDWGMLQGLWEADRPAGSR